MIGREPTEKPNPVRCEVSCWFIPAIKRSVLEQFILILDQSSKMPLYH